MILRRVLIAAALAVMLGVPATADAAKRAAPAQAKAASPLDVAAAVGRRYWGAMPCGGQIKMVARRPLAPGLDPTADAWVTFDSPLGQNNLAAPASSYTNCTIAFGRRRWPTTASMRADWGIFCATMTHELGHLLGHAHDETPGSVMAPVFTDYSSVPATCRAARPARTARKRHRTH
jgi:hypothetical protein